MSIHDPGADALHEAARFYGTGGVLLIPNNL